MVFVHALPRLGRTALASIFACALVRCSLVVDSSGLAGAPGDASATESGDAVRKDAPSVDASLEAGDAADSADAGVRGDASVFPVNGHAYLAVGTPVAISWAFAKNAAEERGGHLATLTSFEENRFVYGLVRDRAELFEPDSNLGPWLGGTRSGSELDASAGWAWVTGEKWEYTRWEVGQPDNTNNDEGSLHYFPNTSRNEPTWNDAPNNAGFVHGYVIEFE